MPKKNYGSDGKLTNEGEWVIWTVWHEASALDTIKAMKMYALPALSYSIALRISGIRLI